MPEHPSVIDHTSAPGTHGSLRCGLTIGVLNTSVIRLSSPFEGGYQGKGTSRVPVQPWRRLSNLKNRSMPSSILHLLQKSRREWCSLDCHQRCSRQCRWLDSSFWGLDPNVVEKLWRWILSFLNRPGIPRPVSATHGQHTLETRSSRRPGGCGEQSQDRNLSPRLLPKTSQELGPLRKAFTEKGTRNPSGNLREPMFQQLILYYVHCI